LRAVASKEKSLRTTTTLKRSTKWK